MCLDLGFESTDCVYFQFVEYLLCVGLCARSWDPEMDKTGSPIRHGAHSLESKMNNQYKHENHHNKHLETIGWRHVL